MTIYLTMSSNLIFIHHHHHCGTICLQVAAVFQYEVGHNVPAYFIQTFWIIKVTIRGALWVNVYNFIVCILGQYKNMTRPIGSPNTNENGMGRWKIVC